MIQSISIKSVTDEVAFSLTAILAASFLLVKTSEITGASSMFPTAICGVMLGCGVLSLVKTLVAWFRQGPGEVRQIDVSGFVYGAFAAVALVVAVLLVPYVGYFSAITLLLIGIPLMLRYRNLLMVLLMTLIFEGAIYLIFVEAFSRRLPAGLLFQ